MREILFRGKRKDNGEWVEGDLLNRGYDYATAIRKVSKFGPEVIGVDPETIGQYTGCLTDKNGKKIFEGDILKGYIYPFYNEEKGEFNYFAEIVWFDNVPAFGYEVHKFPAAKVKGISVGDTDYLEDFYPNCWEVIGNIHDNPELLKGR